MTVSSKKARLGHTARSVLVGAATTVALFIAAAGPAGATTIGTPTPIDGSLSCKDFDTANILRELVVNPLPEGVQANTDGTLTVDTIYFDSTSGWLLYWQQLSTGQSIHSVGISGGGVGVLYSYDPPVTEDAGLHLPAAPAFAITTTNDRYPPIAEANFCYSVPEETGYEGCTLGYWKVKKHHDSWPLPYTPSTLVQSYFGVEAPDATFLTALSFQGGPGVDGAKRILMKQAIASLLNATSTGVDFPLTSAQVIAQVTFALNTGDREVMLSLASTLDAYNNQGCPLN
jgi:hypothetical protein